MAQKRLDDYSPVRSELRKEMKPEAVPVIALPTIDFVKKEKASHVFPPVAPQNLSPSYFVSATYDGRSRKALIKLYEPTTGEIYFWYDNSGHKPYCLTNLLPVELEKIARLVHHEGFDHFEIEKKYDALSDRTSPITKIVANDPLAIGGRPQGSIRDLIPEDYPQVSDKPVKAEDIKVWEARIKYYQSYVYDKRLLPGMIYEVKNGYLVPVVLEETERTLLTLQGTFKEAPAEEQEYLELWARLLEYPAPKFRRAAIDIEVYAPISTRVPDPREADYPVICASLYTSDDKKKVLILKREGVREGSQHLPADITLEYFDTEEKLLKALFEILWEYPFILTFNGDDFDLRYLTHRAMNLGIRRSEIPIEVGRRVCLLRYGVHIDLYKFFFNRSIQIYAFNNRYRDVTLSDVGKAILGLEKSSSKKASGS